MDQARVIPRSLREKSYDEQGKPSGNVAATGPSSGIRWPSGFPEEPEMRRKLEELQASLLRPHPGRATREAAQQERSTDRMTEAEIVTLLRRYVMDIDERFVPRNDDTPILRGIVAAYRNGLLDYPESRQHLAMCLRRVLAMIRNGDLPQGIGIDRCRKFCTRLMEAFEACQAVQARVIETLAEELSAGPAFEREVRALAAELRENCLERAVLRLHPEIELAHATEDMHMQQQLAVRVNLYRQEFGLTNSNHREASASKGMKLHGQADIRSTFNEIVDIEDLVSVFMADVNLAGGITERRIDIEGLRRWASAHDGIQDRLNYAASKATLYGGAPCAAHGGGPFLHPRLATEILHKVLVEADA